jgi:hypothetical protein
MAIGLHSSVSRILANLMTAISRDRLSRRPWTGRVLNNLVLLIIPLFNQLHVLATTPHPVNGHFSTSGTDRRTTVPDIALLFFEMKDRSFRRYASSEG